MNDKPPPLVKHKEVRMKRSERALIAPCVLLLSACAAFTPVTVPPAYKDNGVRVGPCVSGGPDSVAQQFYHYRITHPGPGLNNLAGLRPYLSDALWRRLQAAQRAPQMHSLFLQNDLFTSRTGGIDAARVSSASTLPNTDARNIPLRVTLTRGNQQWQDEVLMVRDGKCWSVDDVRYLAPSVFAPSGSLRLSLENR
jgi:hypothetical protein